MNQEMKDWLNHPVTRNFTIGVNEAIQFYKESLSETGIGFEEREIARKIGVVQGLEALLTYDPDFDENGNIIEEDKE